MASQIMGPEMNAHNTSRFGDHFPCRRITYRKNALMGLNVFFPNIVLEPVGDSLGDKNEFLFPAAFWLSKC